MLKIAYLFNNTVSAPQTYRDSAPGPWWETFVR